jgi:hypothetical protein
VCEGIVNMLSGSYRSHHLEAVACAHHMTNHTGHIAHIWPSLYGLIWGVTSLLTVPSNCCFKANTVWVPYHIMAAHKPINMVMGAQP